ncbi:MAG: hypothetical protein ABMA14_06415 [Hyphomonadaceae bacterium]
MTKTRAYVAAAAFALSLSGCNTQPVKHALFENILPSGYVVQNSSAPIDVASLKAKKLVLIASENFSDYSKEWSKAWEKGGTDQVVAWTGLITGLNSSNYSIIAKASDPRLFGDQIVAMLSEYFGAVTSAPDLATARDQGAEYYGVIDFWGAFDEWGNNYNTKSGLTLLDSKLVQTLSIAASEKTPRKDSGFFDIAGVPTMTAATMQEGLQKNVDQIRAGLVARLGPSRRQTP